MSTAIESAFIKVGRGSISPTSVPPTICAPAFRNCNRCGSESSSIPIRRPLAAYEVRTLLTPIPFQVRLFDLPCLFAGKLHAVLCRDWKSRVKGRDFYDFIWYLGRRIPCNVRHLQARMTQTGHWQQSRELEISQLRQLLRQRFQQVDFDQAKRDVRPFIRDEAELELWDSAFFQSLVEENRSPLSATAQPASA